MFQKLLKLFSRLAHCVTGGSVQEYARRLRMPARHAPRLTPIGPRSSERNPSLTLATMRGRQRAKIREFRDALAAAGLPTLDKQAAVLMLSRDPQHNMESPQRQAQRLRDFGSYYQSHAAGTRTTAARACHDPPICR
jgi:hypothetical protein